MRVALVTTFRADRKEPLVELVQRIHAASQLGEPSIQFTFADAPRVVSAGKLTPRTRILCSMSGVAALIAHISFWVLLPYGWFFEEIGPAGLTVFLLLWVCGYFGLSLISYGGLLFPSFVALLDIALVFIIFKGDVRLS